MRLCRKGGMSREDCKRTQQSSETCAVFSRPNIPHDSKVGDVEHEVTRVTQDDTSMN